MDTLIIKVWPRHLKNGNYVSNQNCPLALAIKEQFPDETFISVKTFGARIGKNHYLFDEKYNDKLRLSSYSYVKGKVKSFEVELTKVDTDAFNKRWKNWF